MSFDFKESIKPGQYQWYIRELFGHQADEAGEREKTTRAKRTNAVRRATRIITYSNTKPYNRAANCSVGIQKEPAVLPVAHSGVGTTPLV